MFESNEPFPCPTLPTEWDCLESNQHLCLARQCSHRCVLVFPSCQRSTSRRHYRRASWHLSVYTVERLPLLSVLVPPLSRTFIRTVSKW
ncbi:hypothetical protein DUF52_08540 [Salmonella enterica]|nr:hypothetical protein [Salmonella enterica]